MKKVLVIVALALVSFANAQKGTVLVAGNVSIDSWKQGNSKTSGFEFSPKVGYQFTNNLTAGIEASIINDKDVAETKTNTTKLGAFLRYGMPLSGAFSFYTDLGLGMQNAKVTPLVGDSAKANGFYVGLVPAVAIDLKKSFCLNFSIGGLTYNSLKPDGGDAANTFNLNFGKTLNIGISKNF